MKKRLLSLAVVIVTVTSFSQVQLNLTGSCSYAGSYDLEWADNSFWDGSGGAQTWSTPNLLLPSNIITGDLVLVEGAYPVDHGNCTFDMACGNGVADITNATALNGNIAVIRRGSCEFGSKALAAQNAGAIACIIVNAIGGPIPLASGSNVTYQQLWLVQIQAM